MKSFLISDNKDTWVGFKLGGIDGVIVHTREEVLQAIKTARGNADIGILIMTELAVNQAREEVMEMKLKIKKPLIIEIPDRHGSIRLKDSISNYIKESVGIKM